MNQRIVAGVLVAALVAGGAGAGFLVLTGDDDPFETYCSEVEDQRGPLGEVLAANGDSGLIAALPIFKELKEKSPDDLTDEWSTVIAHIQDLADVLEEAGVDPAAYDRKQLPDGVTDEERKAIDSAATALGSQVMQAAMAGVQQQARDVCGTPLVL